MPWGLNHEIVEAEGIMPHLVYSGDLELRAHVM